MNHRFPALFLALFFLLPFFLKAQRDDTDRLSAEFHQQRRQALRDLLPEKSLAIVFANPVRNRSGDEDYPYNQNPNLYYLTGYLEPDALLLIFKEPRNIDGQEVNEILFVEERNPDKEIWTGKRLGVEGARKLLGISAVYNAKDFNDFGLDYSKFDNILVKYPEGLINDKTNEADLFDLVYQVKTKLSGQTDKVDLWGLRKLMASLREQKLPEEIGLMQKAIDISIDGFKEMMRTTKPGMTEYQAQAIAEYYMKKGGAENVGYESIAGSGANSCILHYSFNRKKLENNEVILCDMGAEYHGYAADITRTFPVNGKFSKEQAEIYNLVLKAQKAGIEVCRAGNAFSTSHKVAKDIITKGLTDLGILKPGGNVSTYFPHGTSHYLGLEAHDAGTNGNYKPGVVITVEPGIYIPSGSDCDSKWWNIGIRIEDDILITAGDPVNLSGSLPREIIDIEKLMKEKGALEEGY